MEEYRKSQAERWAINKAQESSQPDVQTYQPAPTNTPLPNPWANIPVSGSNDRPPNPSMARITPSNGITHIQDLGYTQIEISDEEMRASPLRNTCLSMWCPCFLGSVCGESHLRDLKAAASTFIVVVTALDIAMYVVEVIVGAMSPQGLSMFAPSLCVLSELGGLFTPEIVNHAQIWRLVTNVFLHGGPLHLLMNMYVQLLSGLKCEYEWGTKTTAGVYALAGLGGSLASAVAAPLTVGVGASGAIVGLLGARMAQLVVEWYERDSTLRVQQAYQSVLFLFMLTLIGAPSAAGDSLPGTNIHVDNYAHGGGLIVGVLVAIAMWGKDSTSCCCSGTLPTFLEGVATNDASLNWYQRSSNIQKTSLVLLVAYFTVLIVLLCTTSVEDVRAPSCGQG